MEEKRVGVKASIKDISVKPSTPTALWIPSPPVTLHLVLNSSCDPLSMPFLTWHVWIFWIVDVILVGLHSPSQSPRVGPENWRAQATSCSADNIMFSGRVGLVALQLLVGSDFIFVWNYHKNHLNMNPGYQVMRKKTKYIWNLSAVSTLEWVNRMAATTDCICIRIPTAVAFDLFPLHSVFLWSERRHLAYDTFSFFL